MCCDVLYEHSHSQTATGYAGRNEKSSSTKYTSYAGTSLPNRANLIMYNPANKKQNITNMNDYMLAKVLGMFKYEGLPDSLPQSELEKMLVLGGKVAIVKNGGDVVAFSGTYTGKQNVYGNYTNFQVINPFINLSKSFEIDKDCIIIKNDSCEKGLMPIFDKFNYLLVENQLSMEMNSFNTRTINTISASDSRTKESAETYLKKISDGERAVIGENAFFEGVKLHGGESRSPITGLIEYHQFIKASLYNEIGLNSSHNMKRERLNTAEVEQDTDSVKVLADNMLQCRQEGVEKVNEFFGLEIKVDFAGAWENEEIHPRNIEESSGNNLTRMDAEEEREMKKTIRQLLEGKQLWQEISNIEPFPFITPGLDSMFIIEHGSLPLFSPIEQETVESLAAYAVNVFGDKWRKLSLMDSLPLDAEEVITETINKVGIVEKQNDTETTDKVSAYNSNDLIDDSGKSENESGKVESDESQENTKETKSINSAFGNLSKLEQLNIIKIAMADVASFLKTDIY